jgi:hypothetical protein
MELQMRSLQCTRPIWLGMLIVVSACDTRVADTEVGDALGTEHRLTAVSASVYQIALDNEIPEWELVLTQCVAWVAAERGASYFTSPTEDRLSLKLNPSQEMWRSPTNYQAEVMIYSPRLFKPRNANPYYVGILFSGERTNLSRLPDWRPLGLDPISLVVTNSPKGP